MKVEWKKNKSFKPDVLLERIDESKTVKNGRVSYSLFDYQEALAALVSMIKFPSNHDYFKQDVVADAINKVALLGDLDKGKVIDEINEIVRNKSSTVEEKFHFLTCISIDQSMVSEMEIEDVKIKIFKDNFPEEYVQSAEKINKHKIEKNPDNYLKVIIFVKAKSYKEAIHKSLRSVDLIRSIWCLFGNSEMEVFGDQWKPINKVRLGSFHTIHKPDGSLASEQFSYDPSFTENPIFIRKDSSNFKELCGNALKKLEAIPYRSKLKEALLRYVRALDERDQNVALIKLWGALESIAAPGESNCDSVTRRCAFLFEENQYHKQILEHLREYRNSNVHSGELTDQAKMYCFQLQYYFHNLLVFHLKNAGEFNSLDEANSFLDLSVDKTVLEKKKKFIEKAIKFLNS